MFKTIRWHLYNVVFFLSKTGQYKKLKKYDEDGNIEERNKLAHETGYNWARHLIEMTGSQVDIEGIENVPDEPCLFVSNHQSLFDIPLLMGYIDKHKGFVAKKELRKVPMLGAWMEYVNCVFLDRDNAREGLKAIKKAINNIKEGASMVIFPEGTRSLDGEIKQFKAGSIKIAEKAKVPVVPVRIRGTIDIQPKGKKLIRASKIKLSIGQAMDLSTYDKEEIKRIHEIVQQKVEEL